MSDIRCRLYGAYDIRVEDLPEPKADDETAIIRVLRGAICPVDLNYYETGKFAADRLSSPLIPGCQATGIIESAPAGAGLKANQVVALSPLRPCNNCELCQAGYFRHCPNMRFSGSATQFQHEDGFFRTRLAHPVKQCFPVPDGLNIEAAIGIEPLAVCLHAFSRAPSLEKKRVLITSAGFLGATCTALARLRGASEIIVADVRNLPLIYAKKMGADRVINLIETYDGLADYMTDCGQVDVVFECSANSHTIAQSVRATRPQGTIVQIAVGGTMPVAINLLITKELNVHGAFRFDTEFPEALRLISSGAIDLSPLVSHILPAHEAKRAFALAANRDQSYKVHLDFAA